MLPLLDNILLNEHMIALKAAGSHVAGIVPTHSRVIVSASGNVPEFLM